MASTCSGDALGVGLETGSVVFDELVDDNEWHAMVFTAPNDFEVTGVRAYITSGDSGTTDVVFMGVSGGEPDETNVLATYNFPDSEIPEPVAWHCFVLSPPFTLDKDGQYAVVFQHNEVSFNLRTHWVAGAPNTNAQLYDTLDAGANWSLQTYDILLELYGNVIEGAAPGGENVPAVLKMYGCLGL